MGGCGAGEGGENEIGPIDGRMWSRGRRRERDRPYRWEDRIKKIYYNYFIS